MCRCDVKPGKAWVWVFAVGVLLAAAALSLAADEPAAAGLKPGDDLPGPFRPWVFTGKHLETQRKRILATIRDDEPDAVKQLKRDLAKDLAGNYHCPLSEQGLNPVVLIFVKGTDPSPALLQLLQKLDESVAKHERDRLAGFVVFLDGAIKDVSKDDDQRFADSEALEPKLNGFKNLTCALDGFEPIQKLYKLDDKADLTLITYDRLKVVSARAVMNEGLDEKGVETVLKDVEALIAASKKAAVVEPMK